MSVKVIPMVPAKRFVVCDGCGKQSGDIASSLPNGWNRIAINTGEPCVSGFGLGDEPDATRIAEHDFCETCSSEMVKTGHGFSELLAAAKVICDLGDSVYEQRTAKDYADADMMWRALKAAIQKVEGR